MAAPIRFDIGGTETRWLDTTFGHEVDKIVDTFELVPKEFVDMGVKMLRPVTNFVGTYSRLWKMVEEGKPVHPWKVLNKWVDDNVNFPGGAYRQWVQDMYHDNKLIKSEFKLRGNSVNLGRINANLLVLAGQNDHIVRPSQAQAAMEALTSVDKEYHEFPIGHGGLVFGKVAKDQVYPLLSRLAGGSVGLSAIGCARGTDYDKPSGNDRRKAGSLSPFLVVERGWPVKNGAGGD